MTWRFTLKKLWILFEFPGNLITGVLSQNWLSGNAVCDKWDPIVDVWQACEKRLIKKSQRKLAVLKTSSIFSTLYLLWTMTNNKRDLKAVHCGWKIQKNVQFKRSLTTKNLNLFKLSLDEVLSRESKLPRRENVPGQRKWKIKSYFVQSIFPFEHYQIIMH